MTQALPDCASGTESCLMNPTRFAADAGTSARQPALPKSPPNAPPVNKHRVLPGVVSGLCTAALFNPWDRALFLSGPGANARASHRLEWSVLCAARCCIRSGERCFAATAHRHSSRLLCRPVGGRGQWRHFEFDCGCQVSRRVLLLYFGITAV